MRVNCVYLFGYICLYRQNVSILIQIFFIQMILIDI